ncbi:MAG: 1-deoxy-D-xylulose-5-phosphate synthase [Endomicrobia bacterium]|nr:1-deoxy-D-xylulose-5-phosphate synthase [Endomicrobiia bacterium]
MKILDLVNYPQDIKNLKYKELEKLAQEIREYILETVSVTGGHLASSLGAVELILSLHYVFDTPRDKIFWDVGHQTYAHKIITGRKEKFKKIRTYGGISGFPNANESEYDSFTVGHASTAVSAALGAAVVRDLENQNHKIIAVVGDGSLSGGLTYEGLNHAGHLGTDFIVVLNDNAMFISKSVGAIAKMLVKLLTLGLVKRIEYHIDKFLRRLSYAGQLILRVAKRFKLLLFPGMLFEEMGFAYVGPVDGHDIKELIEVFRSIREFKGPVIVHVVTRKGKDYKPAEEKPEKYHGVGPFDVNTGGYIKTYNKITFTEVFSEAINNLAQKNTKIIGITAAMTEGCGLEKFSENFKERFFDVGIAEEHAVTFAAGIAKSGYIPICSIYSTFLQRSLDQIIHDVALQNLHVVFMIDRAGLVGKDGPTHHGNFDLSYLRFIPNITMMVPRNGTELKDMFYTAVEHIQGPVAIRYPRDYIEEEYVDFNIFNKIELKTARIEHSCKDPKVIFLGVGPILNKVIKIVKKLNFNCNVINMRFVKPIDEDILKEVFNMNKPIITLEQNSIIGGFFSAISEFALKNCYTAKIIPFALPDKFITYGEIVELEQEIGITEQKIIDTINSL